MSHFRNVIARSPGGTVARDVAKQSFEIDLNLDDLLCQKNKVRFVILARYD